MNGSIIVGADDFLSFFILFHSKRNRFDWKQVTGTIEFIPVTWSWIPPYDRIELQVATLEISVFNRHWSTLFIPHWVQIVTTDCNCDCNDMFPSREKKNIDSINQNFVFLIPLPPSSVRILITLLPWDSEDLCFSFWQAKHLRINSKKHVDISVNLFRQHMFIWWQGMTILI